MRRILAFAVLLLGSQAFAGRAATYVATKGDVTQKLVLKRETAEIAFVADNPGDWLLHCHVLEHQASGMTVCLRVA